MGTKTSVPDRVAVGEGSAAANEDMVLQERLDRLRKNS